jgi:hypothetical protein
VRAARRVARARTDICDRLRRQRDTQHRTVTASVLTARDSAPARPVVVRKLERERCEILDRERRRHAHLRTHTSSRTTTPAHQHHEITCLTSVRPNLSRRTATSSVRCSRSRTDAIDTCATHRVTHTTHSHTPGGRRSSTCLHAQHARLVRCRARARLVEQRVDVAARYSYDNHAGDHTYDRE